MESVCRATPCAAFQNTVIGSRAGCASEMTAGPRTPASSPPGPVGSVVAVTTFEAIEPSPCELIRVLKDPKLRGSLSAGALQRVRTLSSRNSAERSVTLYNRLLDGVAASTHGRGGKSPCLLES